MIPVPIIESIELEAGGRAVIWIRTTQRTPGDNRPVTIFHAIDRHQFDDPTHLKEMKYVPTAATGVIQIVPAESDQT